MNNNQGQQEEWKTMDEYPDYVFSNTGKAYSYKSKRYIGYESHGYISVGLYNNNTRSTDKFLLSRVIYFLFGHHPELLPYREVDHIEHERKDDNSINNLRLVTSKQNKANKGKHSTYNKNQCSSEYVGVTWDKQKQKWKGKIYVGKCFYLGRFENERNCAYVYNRVASTFKSPEHWNNTLGDDFELPQQEENREFKISQAIDKIRHYLNENN
jgi:hypothetical protein